MSRTSSRGWRGPCYCSRPPCAACQLRQPLVAAALPFEAAAQVSAAAFWLQKPNPRIVARSPGLRQLPQGHSGTRLQPWTRPRPVMEAAVQKHPCKDNQDDADSTLQSGWYTSREMVRSAGKTALPSLPGKPRSRPAEGISDPAVANSTHLARAARGCAALQGAGAARRKLHRCRSRRRSKPSRHIRGRSPRTPCPPPLWPRKRLLQRTHLKG
mmetsp:Transcript_73193/g.127087  ORF Transcript_73193/g.127087 Transcript_73193/m.127087 type:complete len:213 (-) Transcript_73193:621-1259(-)